MSNFGENLSQYTHLEVLSAKTPEELLNQLAQIKIPYKIVMNFTQNNRLIVFINCSRKLIKKKEIKNDSFSK